MFLSAVALSASAFNFATFEILPSADFGARSLTSCKVALESRITVVNRRIWLRLLHFDLGSNFCLHSYQVLPLLIRCPDDIQSLDWLNALDSHLWGHWLLRYGRLGHWILHHDWLARVLFVDGQFWGHRLLLCHWLASGHFKFDCDGGNVDLFVIFRLPLICH